MRSTRSPAVVMVAIAGLVTACSSGSSDSSSRRGTTTTTTAPTYAARVLRETEVDPSYRQGLARVEGGWIFSVNNGLFRTDDALRQTGHLVPAIPAEWSARGFDHIGDIDVENGVLYAPLEQPDYEQDHQAMLTYDAATFRYTGGLDVTQHENSFVAVDPTTNTAYTMDRFGGDALVRYDVGDGWRMLPPLKLSMTVDRVQGGDVHAGAIWLSTDDATDGVYRVDLETGKVDALGSVGHADGEGEGIDANPSSNGDLHVLSIDVKVTPVRVIDLDVTTSRSR